MNKRTFDKKILLFLLPILAVVLACVGAFSPRGQALAEAEVSIEVGEKTVHRGQTFSVDVTVTENSGLNAMKLFVDYDPTAMTLVRIERLSGLPQMTLTNWNTATEIGYGQRPFAMLFDSTAPTTDTGALVKLIFESNIDAPIGDYEISLTYDPDNTRKDYQDPVELAIQNGLIHLISGEFSARYVDWDGTLLYERDYNEGGVPAYVGATPTREEDAGYTYVFDGFKGDETDEINVIQYKAHYEATPKKYTILYYVDGLTDDPNDEFTVEDFYKGDEADYGSFVEFNLKPTRENYTFVGWFSDEGFTQPISGLFMPSNDIRIYGYMHYNVRTADIPKIRLTYNELSATEIEVNADMTYNPGISGMILTLQYDREHVRFARFTRGTALEAMQFETTNLAGGLDQENFKFYWESSVNTTDTGRILSMVFDISGCDTGLYPVTFTYDETHDATYVNNLGEIWYTRLDISGTNLPIGEKFYWNEPVGDVTIEVTSPDGKPLDVELVVKSVDLEIEETALERLKQNGLEIKSEYNIKLMRGGEVVTSEQNLDIGIGLTEDELKSKNLELYYVDTNGNLVKYDFKVEDGAAQFSMRNIENWVLVGDAPAVIVDKSWTPETVRSVMLPSLLSVATMAYALSLLSKNKKNKKQKPQR